MAIVERFGRISGVSAAVGVSGADAMDLRIGKPAGHGARRAALYGSTAILSCFAATPLFAQTVVIATGGSVNGAGTVVDNTAVSSGVTVTNTDSVGIQIDGLVSTGTDPSPTANGYRQQSLSGQPAITTFVGASSKIWSNSTYAMDIHADCCAAIVTFANGGTEFSGANAVQVTANGLVQFTETAGQAANVYSAPVGVGLSITANGGAAITQIHNGVFVANSAILSDATGTNYVAFNGGEMYADTIGIRTTGAGAQTIINGAFISAANGIGVQTNTQAGQTATITNSGSIQAAADAISLTGVGTTGATITNQTAGYVYGQHAIYSVNAIPLSVINAGVLTGEVDGIFTTGAINLANSGTIGTAGLAGSAAGVYMNTAAGANNVITTSGIIGGGAEPVYGYGVSIDGGNLNLTVQSGGVVNGGTGSLRLNSAGTAAVTIAAGGTVTGYVQASGTGARTVTINGALAGNYDAGAGANTAVDTITLGATGSVLNVTLGLGNDQFTYQGGAVNGIINAGAGTDAFISTLGAGNSATLLLSRVSAFETLTHTSGNLTLSGAAAAPSIAIIAGNGANSGMVTLTGTTGLTGGITVNGAILRAATVGALGTGAITMIDPTIQFGATGTYANAINLAVLAPASADPTRFEADAGVTATLSGAIKRTGGDAAQYVTIGGAGVVVLTNTTNSWTGLTTIDAGATLQGASGAISGSAIVDNGALILNEASAATLARGISGTGTFTKIGAGNLTLSGINSFTGATTVSAGTLTLTGGAALADASAVTVASGATLNIGFSEAIGSLAGAGSVVLTGGALTIGTDNSSTTFSGVISGANIAYAGSWNVSSGPNWTTQPTVFSGQGAAAFLFGGVASDYQISTISNNAAQINRLVFMDGYGNTSRLTTPVSDTLFADTGTPGYSPGDFSAYVADHVGTYINYAFRAGGDALIKDGTGTLTLSGANTFTGRTVINGGVLQLLGGAAIADGNAILVNAGGQLTVGASETIASIAGAGNVLLNNASLTLGNASGTLTGGVSGTGTLIITAGTETFGGALTNSGGLQVNAGANAVVQSTGSINVAAGAVQLGAAATLTNAGLIAAASGFGAYANGANASITNQASGDITGNVGVSGLTPFTVTNAGDIVGSTSGIVSNSASDVITNSGRIASGTLAGNTITTSGSYGIQLVAGGTVTNNAGALISGNTAALRFQQSGTLANTGTITGAGTGVQMLLGGTITNASGAVISGASSIGLSSANASFITNGGTINGTLQVINTGTLTLNNLAGGIIYSANSAVDSSAGQLIVTNAGDIVGTSWGIVGRNIADSIVNNGRIASGTLAAGVITAGGSNGVLLISGGTLTNNAGAQIIGAANVVQFNATGTITNAGSIRANATGTSTAVNLFGANSVVNNLAGGTISGGRAVVFNSAASNAILNNSGTITGIAGTQGVLLFNNGTVTNTATGSITGGVGIYLNGTTASTVVNDGVIRGLSSSGILAANGLATVTNSGSIYAALNLNGVDLRRGGTVINTATGLIQATDSLDAWGVLAYFATSVTNAGTINGGAGIAIGSGTTSVTNSGTINGLREGILLIDGSTANITNTGTIYGASQGIISLTGTVNLVNQGTVRAGNLSDAAYLKAGSVLNAGLMTAPVYSGLVTLSALPVVNAASGIFEGGTDANFGAGIQFGNAAGGNLINYGIIRDGAAGAIIGNGGTVGITLNAGSTTGRITTGSGDDQITLFTGTGTGFAGVVDGASGITLQNAGTNAAATVGAIDLGGGANSVNLRGDGVGDSATGAIGTVNLAAVANVATLNKSQGGTWLLTGTPSATLALINAGNGTPSGLLRFDGTGALAAAITVNGAIIRAESAGAFGTGLITLVDPTIQYGATGSFANAIQLAVATPASADPSTLMADAGVIATLTGAITQSSAGGVDPLQPLVISGLGTILLTNTANSWLGTTTINTGAKLQGASDTISGSAIIANGTLAYVQPASGTVVQAISGSGETTVSGLAAGETLTFAGALTNAGVSVLDGSHIAFTAANSITRNVQLLGAGAIVDMAYGASLNSSGTYGIFGNQPGQTVNNLGAISATQYGVALGDGSLINNGSAADAIASIIGGNGGIYATGGTLNVENYGLIRGNVGHGILGGNVILDNFAGGQIIGSAFGVTGATLTIANAGQIVGAQYGVFTSTISTITNSGTIATGTVSGTAITPAGFDAIYLGSGGSVTNQAGGTIAGNRIGVLTGASNMLTLDNAGTISGNSFGAVYAQNTATITNQADGVINGLGTAVGIFVAGAATVTNAGLIDASTGPSLRAAIRLNNGGSITNSGTINGTGWGVLFNSNAAPVMLDNQAGGTITGTTYNAAYIGSGSGASVLNAGTLIGGNAAIYGDGTNASITNSGLIRVTGGTANTVISGIYLSAAGANITNSGTIESTLATGRGISLAGGAGTITNLAGGAISGGASGMAILLSGAGYTLDLRSGSTVTGLINAGQSTGTNTVMLAGTLDGDYAGGGAADNVTLTESAIVTGILDGAAGIDALTFDIATTSAFDMAQAINFESRVKTGAGILTLSGVDGQAADWTIAAGTLAASGGSAINDGAGVTIAPAGTLALLSDETIRALSGFGAVDLAGNSLTIGGADANIYAGTISGTGNLLLIGTGSTTLSGANSYTGTTFVDNGTLILGANDVLADASSISVTDDAILDLGAYGDTVGTLALAGTLNGTGTLTAGQYLLTGATVNANLGTGQLAQLGGTTTLNGTAAATDVQILGGTLALGAADRLADAAIVAVASGATLDLGAYADTVGTLALAGTLNGTGTLTAASYQLTGATVNANLGTGQLAQLGGTSTLNGTAAATDVQILGGTLALGAADRLANAATVQVASGATLDLGAYADTVATLALAGTLNGTGTLTAASYQLTGATVNANLGTGQLAQLGGTSTLNGTAAATDVQILGGTLALGAADRLADAAIVAVASGATLDLGAYADTVATLALAGTLNGTGTLTAASYQLTGATVNANLGTGLVLNLGGTSTLNGTAAGDVLVSGGTLVLGAAERLADAALLEVANGATLNLGAFSETVAQATLFGTLAGSGLLTAANYQLNGATIDANLGAGAVTVLGGTTRLNGTSAAANLQIVSGTLMLGASDRLADAANVTIASGATLDLGAFVDTINQVVSAGTLNGTGTLTAGQYLLTGAVMNANLGSGLLANLGGTTTLNGTAAATDVQILGGTLALGAADRLANAAVVQVLSGATLDLGAYADTVATLALAGTLNGTGTLTAASYQLTGATVNANLGTGQLAQLGGTTTLNGTAAATDVRVNAGRLALGAADRLANAAVVQVLSGATLDLGAYADTVATLALAGTLNGTGTLTAASYQLTGATVNANLGTGQLAQLSGTTTLNGTAAATDVQILGGTLALGAADRLANAAVVQVLSGATLDLGAYADTVATLALAGTLNGTGTLTAASYQLTGATVNANLGTGQLAQLGGTTTLNGTAAATDVQILGGTLALGAADRLADAATMIVASGATFAMGGNAETVNRIISAGTINGTATLTAANYQFEGGVVNANLGTGTLVTAAGSTILNGTSAASQVVLAGGTLVLGAAERLANTASLAVLSGATLDLGAFAETVATAGIAGTLNGTGTLTAQTYDLAGGVANANLGTGTLFASGAAVLNGTSAASRVEIANGSLTLGGNERIANGAVVGIATNGTLNLAGNSEAIGTLFGAGAITLGAGRLTVDQSANSSYAGVISGSGGLTKAGSGLLELTGINTYTGPTLITGGNLAVNGSIASAVTTSNGGILSGNGRVGGLTIGAGGILAPGNSIGVMNVAGNLTFAAGSVYSVEVTPTAADLTQVTGTVTLQGGTVQVLAANGVYNPLTRYTILTATGGVTGAFAGVTSNLAFLTPTIEYQVGRVDLALRRNDIAFVSVAQSPNQVSVATALQTLAPGTALFDSLLVQSATGARTGFDALSGEIYASMGSSLLLEGRQLRNAFLTNGRAHGTGISIWANAVDSNGHFDSSFANQTAALDTERTGVVGGFAWANDAVAISVGGGASKGKYFQYDRNASAQVDSNYVGGQAGYTTGALTMQVGGSYSWHDVTTQRSVLFPGFANALQSTNEGHTTQLFGELTYALLASETGRIEPYLGYSHITTSLNAVQETGGVAALSVGAIDRNVDMLHAGVRMAAAMPVAGTGAVFMPNLAIGLQHGFGDRNGLATASIGGSAPYTILGANVPRDAMEIDAGVRIDFGAIDFGVSYDSTISAEQADKGAKFTLNIRF